MFLFLALVSNSAFAAPWNTPAENTFNSYSLAGRPGAAKERSWYQSSIRTLVGLEKFVVNLQFSLAKAFFSSK
jgi:hypothetical protein